MEPNFTLMLAAAVVFALLVLGYVGWRFGGPDALSFAVISGLFAALMDFMSAFLVQNYEYPGQSRTWVFTFIFFGWIGMCGSCLFVAEGILAGPGADMFRVRRLWWQVPLLTGVIAVVLDLFIDPVAVRARYWVWFVEGNVYYGIPLLNYVGWLVLTTLAPLGWLLVARHRDWGYWKKGAASLLAIVPLGVAAIGISIVLNGAVAALGLR